MKEVVYFQERGGRSLSVREPTPGALHSAARGSEQAKA